MKKMVRFTALFLALMAVVSMFMVPASASDIHLDTGSASVYVDNVEITNITAYVDGFGEIRVQSTNDIRQIFKKELDGVQSLPVKGLIVTEWAEFFNYAWSQDDTKLFIFKDNSTPDYDDELVYPGDPVPTTKAEVFLNGIRVNNVDVTAYGGEFFVNSVATLKAIFPKEAANAQPSDITQVTSLRTWATKYKYTMTSISNRCYLNNDGKSPIEMTLDGKLISFPDQQPFVVDPGRTMIPVRSVSEALGCTVTWEPKVNGSQYDRVKIQRGQVVMYLFIGYNKYYLDGDFHPMDVAPQIVGGRTVVPVRFVADALGFPITYVGRAPVPLVELSSK